MEPLIRIPNNSRSRVPTPHFSRTEGRSDAAMWAFGSAKPASYPEFLSSPDRERVLERANRSPETSPIHADATNGKSDKSAFTNAFDAFTKAFDSAKNDKSTSTNAFDSAKSAPATAQRPPAFTFGEARAHNASANANPTSEDSVSIVSDPHQIALLRIEALEKTVEKLSREMAQMRMNRTNRAAPGKFESALVSYLASDLNSLWQFVSILRALVPSTHS